MTRQDPGVPEPKVRLRRLLALLRAAAGPRGESAVAWHSAGFTYVLTATRLPHGGGTLDVDFDPSADHFEDVVQRIRDALTVRP